MNQVHLIGGEKGGVGKSVMSRVFAQYCIDRKIPFQGFDSDRSHGSFMRFYQNYAEHVGLEDFQSLDRLAEAALQGEGVQVLVDLAAQSSTSLRGWMDDTGVLELFREAGVMVNCWHILDDGRDSLEMLGRLLDDFKTETRYVIVLNHGRGARFDAFHASSQKIRAMELGAKIIELSKLHEGSMRQVDHSNSSFWAAIHASENGDQLLGLLDRQRVKVWLRKIYAELDSLGLSPANRQY
ncbi:MAG: mobilization protein [Luteolibacter sp.]